MKYLRIKYLKLTIIMAVLAAAVTSCKVDFPLDSLDDEPLIYLDAMAYYDNPESTSIQIYIYGVPPAGKREIPKGSKCEIRTYLNSMKTAYYTSIPLDKFYGLIPCTMKEVYPGDEIMIEAQGEGFAPIKARTIIPEAPPVPEIKFNHAISKNLINIKVTLKDDGKAENYYALTFYQTSIKGESPDETIYGNSAELAFGSPTDMGIMDIGPFDVAWKDFGNQIYYGLSDATFNGGSKTLDLNLKLDHIDNIRTYFRVGLLSISKEKMKYEIAQYDKYSNILGNVGLAPITFAYTNVQGGAGYLGAHNQRNSNWMIANFD